MATGLSVKRSAAPAPDSELSFWRCPEDNAHARTGAQIGGYANLARGGLTTFGDWLASELLAERKPGGGDAG